MLEKLYGVVEKNWDKFTEAPLIFLLPLVAGAVIGWIVKKTIAQGHIDALLARIETLNERLTSREVIYNERLKGKDDVLAEYRERLKIAPTDQTAYSRLTNAELRQKALSFADKLRGYENSKESEQDERRMRYHQQMRAANSDEERKHLFNQESDQTIAASPEFHAHYNKVFRADAILLRDEIQSRLPETVRNIHLVTLDSYDFPVNDFGVQAIIVDIERLAKSLP
jgi:hypothetical protein